MQAFKRNADLNDLFDAVFVVSLPNSSERRDAVMQQFDRRNLGVFEWFDAIDGAKLDLDSLRKNRQVAYCKDQARELFPGEIGCYLSHISIFKVMQQRELKNALLCEDDITFTENAAEIFSVVMRELPDNWDIVYFHSHEQHGDTTERQTARRRVSTHVRQGWNESQGTLCYAINKRCAHYLLSYAFPIDNPIDALTNWPSCGWCAPYQGYIADPFPCYPGNFSSDIGNKARRQKISHKQMRILTCNPLHLE